MSYVVTDGTGRLITEPSTFGSYIDRYGSGMVGMLTSIVDHEVDPGHWIYVTDIPEDAGWIDGVNWSITTYLTCFSPHQEAHEFVAIQDNGEYDNSEYTMIHREGPINTQYVLGAMQQLSLVSPTTFTNNYKVRWKFRVNSDAISRPLQYQNVLDKGYGYLQACWYIGIYTYVRLAEDVIRGWAYYVNTMQENASFGGSIGLPYVDGGGST